MTKIVFKSDLSPLFDVLKMPLGVLFHPAIIAYRESESSIYLAEPYAKTAIARLEESGLPLNVVQV
jgi:hypothetical protein